MELRLGLVGCGRLAERSYVTAIERARGLRLAAVADVHPDRCRAVAPSLPAFSSARELLDAEVVDALVIATPAHTHVDDARAAAASAVPTLVEKPPAPSAAEAAELVRLDPAPYIGFNRRFDPGVVALRERVPAGGRLELRLQLRTRRAAWRPHTVADDALLDLGPHLVDLALWLSSGRPGRVRARLARERASLEVELAGGRGTARIDCAGDRPHAERFEVRDGDRRLADHRVGGLLRSAVGLGRRRGDVLVESLSAQLEAFAGAVLTTAPPELARAEDGARVMAVLDAARRSAARGWSWEAVSVPP